MPLHTARRLYVKHQGDLKLAIDTPGNLSSKGVVRSSAGGHSGLVFKSSQRSTPCVSVTTSFQVKDDGVLVVDHLVSNAGAFLVDGGPALVFKRGGNILTEFAYDSTNPEEGTVRTKVLALHNFGMRKNAAKMEQVERDRFRDAMVALDQEKTFIDGVSYWDKQDQIHQATHVHGGPEFLPRHRELIRRLEELLQEVDELVTVPYWGWTTDPRNSPDGQGGNVDLFTAEFMGSASGRAGPPFDDLDNQGNDSGSRECEDPAAGCNDFCHTASDSDHWTFPPKEITRNVGSGDPGIYPSSECNTWVSEIVDCQLSSELHRVYSGNDANVLVMSLQATSPDVAKEILEAWFSETVQPDERATIDHLKDIEARHAQR